jgi:hypothetical protein
MEDARQGVCPFTRAQQFARPSIESRTPLDQLGHANRALGHQRLGRWPINDSIPRIDGVFKMESNVLITPHGHGDSTLRIVCVRLAEGLLGHDQDIAVPCQSNGCAKAGNACTHHQEINLHRLRPNL